MTDISLKRHQRYCRAKLERPAPARQRSCLACIRAKSRCDLRKPACGLCQEKGRKCTYSGGSSSFQEGRSTPPTSWPARERRSANSSAIINTHDATLRGFLRSDKLDTHDTSDLGAGIGPSTFLSSDVQICASAESAAPAEATSERSDGSALYNTLEAPYPIASRLLRPKERLTKMTNGGKLVCQIIYSFPGRMTKESSCPPFIHPSMFVRSLYAMGSDDPITICRNMSCKFELHWARCDSPVWDAIALEQEKIYDQRFSPDKWLHLSSAQAVIIYLLMLAAAGENALARNPSLPTSLLFTLKTSFGKLHQLNPGYVASVERGGDRPAWSDWIFAESKLRTAIVYFILALHFNVNFGLPCDQEGDTQFENVELPAAKSLWEAKDELPWCEEYDLAVPYKCEFVATCIKSRRLKYRDLISFNKDSAYEQDRIDKTQSSLRQAIEKWYKELDEFGTLVAMCSILE